MPALNSMAQPGETVEHGTVIRLKHVKTRANLHSHPGFTSPSTGQQEVTAFGSNDHESDENDEWRVLSHSSRGPWRVDELFTLTHVVTNHHLHSHDIKLKHDDDHNEITAFGGNDENDQWVSTGRDDRRLDNRVDLTSICLRPSESCSKRDMDLWHNCQFDNYRIHSICVLSSSIISSDT